MDGVNTAGAGTDGSQTAGDSDTCHDDAPAAYDDLLDVWSSEPSP